jgi:hypothetical protein
MRDIPRWALAAVVLFWASTVLIDAAAFRLDPEFDALQARWAHFLFKRGAMALYWAALTVAALVFYRDRPVGAGNLWRHVGAAALAIPALAAGFALYMGAALHVMSGGRLAWRTGVAYMWSGELLYACLTAAQVLLAASAFHHYARLRRRAREREQLELRLLRAQLEPHFLVNALNSIAALVRLGRPAPAVDALQQLGALLRGVLDVGQRQLTTWEWERDFTRHYVALQKLRFADQLQVALDEDGVPPQTPFPALLLQPLIENAVRHGPLLEARPCAVTVGVRREGGRIRVAVSNEVGAGVAAPSPGVGLRNLAARLQAIYGEELRFAHGRREGRFLAEAEFPERPPTGGEAPA